MQKLEQIESFGAFLDFLSNPDEYRELVKDARAAAKEHKKIVEDQRKIKDIDAWKATEIVRLSKIEESLQERETSLIARTEKGSDEAQAAVSKLNKDRRALTARSKVIDEREKAIGDLEKQKAKIIQLENEYAGKLANLSIESDKLKQKAADIAAMVGG